MQTPALGDGQCPIEAASDSNSHAVTGSTSPEVLGALREQATASMFREVRRFAGRRARVLRHAGHAVPSRYARELVHDACADTWSGAARWDPTRRTLAEHLTVVIRQRTWLMLRRLQRFEHISLDAPIVDDAEDDELEAALVSPSRDAGPNVRAILLDRVCEGLRRCNLGGDDLLVLGCWERDVLTRRAILENTGLSRIAYACARRRLLQRLGDLPVELMELGRHHLAAAS